MAKLREICMANVRDLCRKIKEICMANVRDLCGKIRDFAWQM